MFTFKFPSDQYFPACSYAKKKLLFTPLLVLYLCSLNHMSFIFIRKYKITVAMDTYSVVKSFMYSNTCIRLIIIVDFEAVQPFPFW